MNLENEAAQVEAEKCGVIAKDVTELQARCEKDLAAAEPLVAQAEAALDTLNKKDLGEQADFYSAAGSPTEWLRYFGNIMQVEW